MKMKLNLSLAHYTVSYFFFILNYVFFFCSLILWILFLFSFNLIKTEFVSVCSLSRQLPANREKKMGILVKQFIKMRNLYKKIFKWNWDLAKADMTCQVKHLNWTHSTIKIDYAAPFSSTSETFQTSTST